MPRTETDPLALLRARFTSAVKAAFPALASEDIDPLITAGKQPEQGDYQSNVAMGLAKRVGKPPRDVAKAVVAHVEATGLLEPLTDASIAGPGFINVKFSAPALASFVAAMDTPTLGVASATPSQTMVVDLMGVNLAKQMHVGHLRSPIIGDAVARVLERLGHTVLRQNHVGDWGLNIAMTTARVMRLVREGSLNLDTLTLDDLDKAYTAAQKECQRDMDGLKAAQHWRMGPKAVAELEAQVDGATAAFLDARQTLLRLQAKEPETYAVWQKIYSVTMKVCVDVCTMLNVNVTNAHTAGESSYADELIPMVDDLVKRGIAIEDQGALIVRVDEPGTPWAERYGVIKEPCLIRKSDGGYLYATTDVCAVRRRVQKLGAERAIYVIDARQNLHLRQVYAASLKAGYSLHPATKQPAVLEHAAFGSVLGEDGRPFKTRSGDTVKLADLIQETFDRAGAAVRSKCEERGVTLTDAELAQTSRCVGIAALKYADLSTDRVKDYVFSFDRMLAFEGNTGPYQLYACVRIKNIFRKAADDGAGDAWKHAPIVVHEHAEKQLALALLRYPGALRSTADALEPHRLCAYLYEVAGAFSTFYDQCKVVNAPDASTRDARLKLCHITLRVLEDGLGVLGIPVPERM
ncbi:MAG TPA: arginine--tRNA ligase [Phycisphaerales bacterium]|nr:arginine--tRNA ligase [Phycisphaerales bacterium]